MDGLPFPVDAHPVENPEDLEKTVRAALAKKPDLLILGGGDGTISGLVDLMVGHDVILGVLPLGTANSFARTLGIPLDIAGAVEVIRTGVPRRIDLGMIDKDYFANCAAMGLSPKIAETVPHNLKKMLRAGGLSRLGGVAVPALPPVHADHRRGRGGRADAGGRGAHLQRAVSRRGRADRMRRRSIRARSSCRRCAAMCGGGWCANWIASVHQTRGAARRGARVARQGAEGRHDPAAADLDRRRGAGAYPGDWRRSPPA